MAEILDSSGKHLLQQIDSLMAELEAISPENYNDSVRDELSVKFNKTQSEYQRFASIFDAIKVNQKMVEGIKKKELEFTTEELQRLEQEEELLKGQKEIAEFEEKALQEELLDLMKTRTSLEQSEESFWDRANKIEIENIELEIESSFTRQQIMNFNAELDRLSKIYILNEVFSIKIHNDMATISKLHIGKNPDTGSINWDETNAGIGHAMLLLNFLCVKNNIRIPNVEFEPLGNISTIRISQKNGPTRECRLAGPPAGSNEEVV